MGKRCIGLKLRLPTPGAKHARFSIRVWGHIGNMIPLDSFGFPQSFEFVALKYMQFEVLAQIGPHVLQIQWPPYSTAPSLY